jgi:Ran GTPase-activating protein (RanGAP) involved in mRNA processing and transport
VEGFRRLVASPHLGNLTTLRLPFNSIGNGGISALFDAASLTSLTALDLSETGSYGRYAEDPIIKATGMEALAAWPGLARLRSLALSGNDVRRAGLRALLRSPRCSGLKALALRGNGLTGEAMQELGSARGGLQLDFLDLGENILRDLGAGYLANAPCLRALKVLKIDRCEMTATAARRLAGAPFLGSLRRLNVNDNSFSPEGLAALLEAEPQELHTLRMVDNDLGDAGVSQLAESPASDTLLEVDLARNGLADAAVQALAESAHLSNLLVLRLTSNRISAPAAATLADSPLGKRLAVLAMSAEADEDEMPF